MFKYEIYFAKLRPTADKNSTNSKALTSNTPDNTAKDVTLPKLQEQEKMPFPTAKMCFIKSSRHLMGESFLNIF